MRFFAWLMSFYMPLCAGFGAAGIPVPGIVDFSQLHRKTHSQVLLAPAGFAPKPEIVAPVYKIPPATLYARLQAIAARQTRTYALDTEPGALQAAWVVRSWMFNFPDVIEIAVVPEPGGSSFVFYGHAIYGWFDYGVNARRAESWVKILNEEAG